MNRPSRFQHTIDFLFVLVLFCLFALTSLLVILIGAKTYKGTVTSMDENYEFRTLTAYLNEKIRQNDNACKISTFSFGETDVLVLTQEIDDQSYSTCLYAYAGSMREVLLSSLDDFSLSAGQDILPAYAFHASYSEDHLLTITFTTTSQKDYTLYLAPKS